jgi:hypothetical protein
MKNALYPGPRFRIAARQEVANPQEAAAHNRLAEPQATSTGPEENSSP